jgi:hypothetical protein
MATTQQLQQYLADAQLALHELLTGVAVTDLVDQNGQTTRYYRNSSSLGELRRYISELEAKLSGYSAPIVTTFDPYAGW